MYAYDDVQVARILTTVGVDRLIVVDLHCGQIQGFFPPTVPVDNIAAGPVGALYFARKKLKDPVVVSPDAGGVRRAKEFAERLQHALMTQEDLKDRPAVRLAMIVKQRSKPGVVASMDLIGDVSGSDCIICDDMIDTGGTLCKAAQTLMEKGAQRVFAFASHGVFSGPALGRIQKSVLKEVVVLDTLPIPKRQGSSRVHQISVAPLLAEAIRRVHTHESVSLMWKKSPASRL